MIDNSRWLAALLFGCILSTPALAENYRRMDYGGMGHGRFYFGVWGGAGEFDTPSKSAMDQATLANLGAEVAAIPLQPQTELSVDSITGSTQDDTQKPWGVQVGYRFNKWVAGEVGYVNLGEFLYRLTGTISGDYASSPTSIRQLDGGFERATQLTSTGLTAAVLGLFELGQHFDLHVRGGIYGADTRVTNRLRFVNPIDQTDVFNLLHRRDDASETEWFAGLGVGWNVSSDIALRVEYQKFFSVGDAKTGEQDFDAVNLAVLFK